jgi:hypothetical protein
MVVRDKQMLISCVSFDSVNSEKCGQLLEIVIAFIHVSVVYCGVVSTFVIEIKSYLSILVCPEQKCCKHTPISFAVSVCSHAAVQEMGAYFHEV